MEEMTRAWMTTAAAEEEAAVLCFCAPACSPRTRGPRRAEAPRRLFSQRHCGRTCAGAGGAHGFFFSCFFFFFFLFSRYPTLASFVFPLCLFSDQHGRGKEEEEQEERQENHTSKTSS